MKKTKGSKCLILRIPGGKDHESFPFPENEEITYKLELVCMVPKTQTDIQKSSHTSRLIKPGFKIELYHFLVLRMDKLVNLFELPSPHFYLNFFHLLIFLNKANDSYLNSSIRV